MNVRRVYVDTSVIGGCFDDAFCEHSQALFLACERGQLVVVISDLTVLELEGAPAKVRDFIAGLSNAFVEAVETNQEALALAESYVEAEVLGARHFRDATHIATATLQRVDVLVSWNFRHIVNLDRIRGFNSVNLRQGYPLIEIRTPKEVLPQSEENND